MRDLRRKKEDENKNHAEREKVLAAVKIKKEDLDLLCAEFPLCEADALQRVLRQNEGDLVAAMRAAVRNFPTNS